MVAPQPARLDHFGRRSLGSVELVVTKTNRLSGLVGQPVAVAAGIKYEVWRDKALSPTNRPAVSAPSL
ncbi:hypothetical protein [Streptomyces sp. enrichment culture]|uniref:hypothetical protein n=1 Tax=Streptomyces sp. enrichment culture TaxID=1795815 RepID=UPI003F579100